MAALSNLEGNLGSFEHQGFHHLHGILFDVGEPLYLGFLLFISHAYVEAYTVKVFLLEKPFRKSIIPE